MKINTRHKPGCSRTLAVIYAAAVTPQGITPEVELCDCVWERLAALEDPARRKAKVLMMVRTRRTT